MLSCYLHVMLPRLPVTTGTIVLPTNLRLHLTAGAEYTYSYGGATAYDPQSPRRRVVPRSRRLCRLPRVSLTYLSQVIPGYSRRFMCSRSQGHGMDEPHTTIPHLVVVPIRLSPKVPAPLRRSTSMRSPHLPVAGAIGSRVSSLRTTPHVPRRRFMCSRPQGTWDGRTSYYNTTSCGRPDTPVAEGSRPPSAVDVHAIPPPASRRCHRFTRFLIAHNTSCAKNHTSPTPVYSHHRERRATKATLHRERRILHDSTYSHHRERRATRATLHRERRILHDSTYSHHRERRATRATLHRERRILHGSICSHHRERRATRATLHRERRILHNSICSHHRERRATRATLHWERRILHYSTCSHHRERRAT